MSIDNEEALDVWLRIPEGEEESESEANTFEDNGGFRVEWYHTAVGLVSSEWFPEYDQAAEWLRSEGYEDYTT